MTPVLCPGCGAELPRTPRRLRLTCRACGLRMMNPLLAELPPAADQVRRDRRYAGTALIVLAGLGAHGAVVLGFAHPAFTLVALLGFLGLAYSRSEIGKHPLFKALLGVFAFAGVFTLLAIVAIVYLFVACSQGAFQW